MSGNYYGIANEKALTSIMQPMYKYKMAKRIPKKYGGFDATKIESEMHDYLFEHALDLIEYVSKNKIDKIKSVNKRVSKLMDYRKYWVDMALWFKNKYNVHDEDVKVMCKYLSLIAWFKSDDFENNDTTRIGVKLDLDTKFGRECQLKGQTEFSAMSLAFHYMAGKDRDGCGSAVWGEYDE